MSQRGYALEDFKTVKDLGNGSFGVVKQVIHKETGEAFAMKVLDKQRVVERGLEEQLKREVLIQLKTRHPNVVRMHYYFEDPTTVRCLLEFADKGQLFAYLRRNVTGLPEPRAAQFFADSASGLAYLHSLGVAHRDVKPENILLFGDNLRAKLGDLGWCVELTAERPDRHTFCGTTDYLSPEMVLNEPHDASVDLWALGVLLFEMLVARAPFAAPSQKEAIEKICAAQVDIPPSAMSPGAAQLVTGLLRRSPRDRLPLSQVLAHPWVATLAGTVRPGASLDDTSVVEHAAPVVQQDLDGTVLMQRRPTSRSQGVWASGGEGLDDTRLVQRGEDRRAIDGAALPVPPSQGAAAEVAAPRRGPSVASTPFASDSPDQSIVGSRAALATGPGEEQLSPFLEEAGAPRRKLNDHVPASAGGRQVAASPWRWTAPSKDGVAGPISGGSAGSVGSGSSSSVSSSRSQHGDGDAYRSRRQEASAVRRLALSIEAQDPYEEQSPQQEWLRGRGMGETRSMPGYCRPGEDQAGRSAMIGIPGARMKPSKSAPDDPIAELFAKRDTQSYHRAYYEDDMGDDDDDDEDDDLGFQAAGGVVLEFFAGLFGGTSTEPPARRRRRRKHVR